MAIPAAVQSTSNTTRSQQPSIVLPNVAAGHLLIAAWVEQFVGIRPVPTDSPGNAWQNGGTAVEAGKGCNWGLFYAWNAKAGTTTITLPTTAPCAYAAAEFSNIIATGDPEDNAAGLSATDTSLTLSVVWTQKSEMLVGLIVSPQAISFGLPAGVSPLQAQQSPNGSLALFSQLSPSVGGSATYTWTTPSAADIGGQWLSLLHS